MDFVIAFRTRLILEIATKMRISPKEVLEKIKYGDIQIQKLPHNQRPRQKI